MLSINYVLNAEKWDKTFATIRGVAPSTIGKILIKKSGCGGCDQIIAGGCPSRGLNGLTLTE